MLALLLALLPLLPLALAWNYTSQTNRVVTYFTSFNNGTEHEIYNYVPLRPIVDEQTGITDVLLFVCDIHDTYPYVTVGGYAPDNTTGLGPTFWEDVSYLRNNSVNVLASFGGYESDMFLILESNFTFYYDQLRDFFKAYPQLSGIDLDVEPSTNTLTSYATGETTLKLLKSLDRDFGSEFQVSMAPIADDLTGQYNPQFFSGFNYNILDQMARDEHGAPIINWFNGQFYNGYGNCNNGSTYNQTIFYGDWDPSRVVFLVASSNGVASGWCPLEQVAGVAAGLAANYSNFGGVGGYDYVNAGSTDNVTVAEWYQTMAKAIGN